MAAVEEDRGLVIPQTHPVMVPRQVRVRLARDQLSYRPALQHFSQLCGTAAVGSSGFPGERPRLLSEMPSFYFDVQGGKGGARPKRDARRFLYGRGAHRAPLKHVYVQQPNSRGRRRRTQPHPARHSSCGTRAPAAGVVGGAVNARREDRKRGVKTGRWFLLFFSPGHEGGPDECGARIARV